MSTLRRQRSNKSIRITRNVQPSSSPFCRQGHWGAYIHTLCSTRIVTADRNYSSLWLCPPFTLVHAFHTGLKFLPSPSCGRKSDLAILASLQRCLFNLFASSNRAADIVSTFISCLGRGPNRQQLHLLLELLADGVESQTPLLDEFDENARFIAVQFYILCKAGNVWEFSEDASLDPDLQHCRGWCFAREPREQFTDPPPERPLCNTDGLDL